MNLRTLFTTALVAAGAAAGLASQVSAQSIKIGIIAPLTGAGAPWGMAMRQAGAIAAAKANADGGLVIGGKKYNVEVIVYDDQYKAAEAVSAYNRLVNQDGVKYVVILTSPSTMAVKEKVESDKVLALTASFTSKAIDNDSRFMVRLSSTPANYAKPFAAWIAQSLSERRVVIVNPNDETGWEIAKFAEVAFRASGFQVLASELFDRTQKEFQPMLTKIIGMNPEIIDLGSASPPTAGLIIRQARELGYKGSFVKTGGPGPREILEAAGSKEAVEGMIAIDYANINSVGFQRLAVEYRKAIGQDPNQMIAPYYDAVTVLLKAIEMAGTVDDTVKVSATLAKVLPTESVQGGRLNYGDRQILSPIFVTRMTNGEAIVVGKVDVAQ